jgi:hypothetical protein
MTPAIATPSVTRATSGKIPRLVAGDRLSRDEFERRYQAMPGVNKAELIEGIVHMPSPVRFQAHSNPHSLLNGGCFLTLLEHQACSVWVTTGPSVLTTTTNPNPTCSCCFLKN